MELADHLQALLEKHVLTDADVALAKRLVAIPSDAWGPGPTRAAWEVLCAHRPGEGGPAPDGPASRTVRSLYVRDGQLVVAASYDPDLHTALRALRVRHYDSVRRDWSIPAAGDAALELGKLINAYGGFHVTDQARALLEGLAHRRLAASEPRARVEVRDGAWRVILPPPRSQADWALVGRVRAIDGVRFWRAASAQDQPYWRLPNTPQALGALRELVAEPDVALEIGPADKRALDKAAGAGTVSGEGSSVVMRFDYDPELVAHVKNIAGRRYEKTDHSWRAPATPEAAAAATALAQRAGLTVENDSLQSAVDAHQALVAQRRERAPVRREIKVSAETVALEGVPLMDFQRAGIAQLLTWRRALLADEPGLGKTVQALATIALSDAWPAVVICPAGLKLTWRAEAAKWLPEVKVAVLEGRKPKPEQLVGAQLLVLSYDIAAGWQDALCALGPRALVCDESHYVKEKSAKRTKALRAIAKHIDSDGVVGCLSGTPIVNRPRELVPQLQILDRISGLGGAHAFKLRYCNLHHNGFGMDDTGASNLDELHRKLAATCMVRRRKADVATELPAKSYPSVPLALAKPARKAYEKVAADVIGYLSDRAAGRASAAARAQGASEHQAHWAGEQAAGEAADRALRAEALVKLSELRQAAAKAKLPAAIAWIEDFLASGEKLVCFAHHKSIQAGLREAFPEALTIGEQTPDHQAVAERFQEDPAARLIVCSLQAASHGLTLTAASNVCFLELPWTWAGLEQAADRCHRIGQDKPVSAWMLLADETIDMHMAAILEHKRLISEQATDGLTGGGGEVISGALIDRLCASAEKVAA